SEGNPLFAEELLAASARSEGLPLRLADLLLARVDALPDPSRRVVRTASVAGSRIDPDPLVAVTGMSGAEVEAGLRDALDANVLAQRGGVRVFRRGLLREARSADLLPGERTRFHEGFARAIQDRIDVDARPATMAEASNLALHWHAASDLPRAFTASVRAGQLAEGYGAAEAIQLLELALDLWDRVPDPVA